MEINYYKEFSAYLDREMEFKVFGHAGRPILVLPNLNSRFYDWENFGMVEKAAWWIDRGKVQLFCVDSIDGESWAGQGDVRRRAEMQEKWFLYLTRELYPRMIALNGGTNQGKVLAAGIELGALHAVNCLARRPDLFNGVIALSGRYDTQPYFGDAADDLVFRSSPLRYLADTTAADPALAQWRQADPLILCVGQGAWEDDFLASTQALAQQLERLDVPVQLELWGYDVTHDWVWWQKQWQLFLSRVCG